MSTRRADDVFERKGEKLVHDPALSYAGPEDHIRGAERDQLVRPPDMLLGLLQMAKDVCTDEWTNWHQSFCPESGETLWTRQEGAGWGRPP